MSYVRQREGDLTPKEIVEELDKYVIGQKEAKRAVAIALRNRWRRQQVDEELRDEIVPKNIIMIGPTGVGKTEIARRLARLSGAPFIKVEASKFTEVGYVGRDVESMVRDLVDIGINLVRAEEEEKFEARVLKKAEDNLIDVLMDYVSVTPERPPMNRGDEQKQTFIVAADGVATQGSNEPISDREIVRQRLKAGDYDDLWIEIELKEALNPLGSIFGGKVGQSGHDLEDIFGSMVTHKVKKKRIRVREAMRQLKREEADKIVNMDQIVQEALERTQRAGIIFIDEIDKIATSHASNHSGADVSRQGVQRDLLPIIEGSSVTTKHGIIKTDHILFIAAGAFHLAKPSDLIPELQGRFPIRVELESLTQEHFERILAEPTNSLTRQYIELMRTEDITVEITPDAISTLAEMAYRVNTSLENIGARRLHTIMERVFEDLSFDAPEMDATKVVVTSEYVREKLDGILQDEDLSRYIL